MNSDTKLLIKVFFIFVAFAIAMGWYRAWITIFFLLAAYAEILVVYFDEVTNDDTRPDVHN